MFLNGCNRLYSFGERTEPRRCRPLANSMTKRAITLATLLTLFSIHTIYGQEVVKKQKYRDGVTEEFFVLKKNKNIKQGSALTTHKDILGKKYIIELGQYDQNEKSGKWLFFYFMDPNNSLKAMGSYAHDLKDGNWRYYYPTNSSDKSLNVFFGSEKRTNVIETKRDTQAFQIELDTSGQQVICTGNYKEDKKTGIWSYYSRSGYLLQRFDHDSNEFRENLLSDHENSFLVYLGGPERFFNFYYMAQQERKTQFQITKTSEVIYEVEKNGNYRLVSANGDENYRIQIEQILNTIPNEWIVLDGETWKKLRLISKIVVVEDSFNRFKSSLDFKVVD